MHHPKFAVAILGTLILSSSVFAQDIVLHDVETTASDVSTIFKGKDYDVVVTGASWDSDLLSAGLTSGTYTTSVNGEVQATGEVNIDLNDPPDEVPVGSIKVSSGGTKTVSVDWTFGTSGTPAANSTAMPADVSGSTSREYQAFGAGASLVPLIVILLLAVCTGIVELSLTTGIFVGACMVSGNIKDGFKLTLEKYILEALADVGHGYVYLFTLFLAGLVAIMEKSGGIKGLTVQLARIARTPRTGLLAAFFSGCLIFFDDYANCLVIGQTMLPILDSLGVSREKLAYVVDATAAPIASLVPVSSWVGFEVGLIQEELDRIVALGWDLGSIKASGYGVFLESIKYRYYPIFMLFLQILLIITARDFGFMLTAERKTQVYGRTDGGKGRAKATEKLSSGNAPKEFTPAKMYNMLIPVALLIFFIFYLLVQSGKSGDPDETFQDYIMNSDSYVALLFGTMATALCTAILYLIQYVNDDRITLIPPVGGWFNRYLRRDRSAEYPKALMNVKELVESFLFGMTKIFPALIVLTLAWAAGSMMGDVGTDRLFSSWIVGGVDPTTLPTLSFIISLLIATALGSSWGTMAILFPLITIPTFEASGGDPGIFYGTVAGILSGSVAGDHISPISDTTVLSSLAAQCDLFRHVMTQAPYVAVVVLWSILVGTLPVGRGRYSTGVGIFLGFVFTLLTVFLLAVPVISSTGRFDPFQELMMRFDKRSGLHLLKKHTALCHARGGPVSKGEEVRPEDIPEGGYRQSVLGRMQGAMRSSMAGRRSTTVQLNKNTLSAIQEEKANAAGMEDVDLDEESGGSSDPKDVPEAFVEEDNAEDKADFP